MEYEEFLSRCRGLFDTLDSTIQSTEEVVAANVLHSVPDEEAEDLKNRISYLICNRFVGNMAGYYKVFKLDWEEGKKTYLVDYAPTERTALSGEFALNERIYYVYVKTYPKERLPLRFAIKIYGRADCYTIIYHEEEKWYMMFGKTLLPENEIYNDIVAAARIAKSASRFLVPIQDHEGKIIGHTTIGNEEILLSRLLTEAFRRRLIGEMENES